MKKTALVVTDMINSYDHPDAEKLVKSVEERLPNMVDLVERAASEDVDVIYVNDNFGSWNSNREQLVEEALETEFKHLVEPLRPDPETSFVVKARHSAFYETPLEYLLREKEIERIVLIGQVTEQCILYSALDAYLRHLDVTVPRDAVAHIFDDLAEASLTMMERNMHAQVCEAADCRLGERH